jgi:hypothetical protein
MKPLGHWDGERGTPANAMHLQNAAAALLVLMGAGLDRQRFPLDGRVHGAGVLAVLPAHRARAVPALTARA